MGKESAVIHTNPNLKHQIEFAEYLSHGLKKHGVNACITSQIDAKANIHIVLGPHYAKSQWLGHSRTILLDRCFWGNHKQVVSLAWMTKDGGRVVLSGDNDRPKPELQPWKTGDKVIELVDFGGQPSTGHNYRLHPTTSKPTETLDSALRRHDIAVGGVGTAMVTAAIYGLPVVCLDNRSVCLPMSSKSTNPIDIIRPSREQWLNNLSYMNWSGSEIESGEAFEYLL